MVALKEGYLPVLEINKSWFLSNSCLRFNHNGLLGSKEIMLCLR